MSKLAMMVLASGFEETEAVVPMDIVRRSGTELLIAGVGGDIIEGAHGISIKCDSSIEKQDKIPDAIIFPGGMPGAENLAVSSKVKELILKMDSQKKIIAAICASPALVLAPLGILDGREATCYPGLEKNFPTDVKFSKEKVVKDGHIITSRGPATASLFGLKIVETLCGEKRAEILAEQMLYNL